MQNPLYGWRASKDSDDHSRCSDLPEASNSRVQAVSSFTNLAAGTEGTAKEGACIEMNSLLWFFAL